MADDMEGRTSAPSAQPAVSLTPSTAPAQTASATESPLLQLEVCQPTTSVVTPTARTKHLTELCMQLDALLSEAIPVPEEFSGFQETVQRLKQTLLQLKSVQVRDMTIPAHSAFLQSNTFLPN